MYSNHVYRNIDRALPHLCARVMKQGTLFESRNGSTRDLNFIGLMLTEPWEREITLPSRKHNIAAQIAETMWVLSGRDDIEFLSQYLPRAVDFSDDGKVWRGAYGKRIRRWTADFDYIDQLAHVVAELRKDNNTRRAVIAIYDPAIDTAPGKDIPCNDFLTFSIRNGMLDMGVTIRSNDLIWGWSGINAFEWSVLQEIIAVLVGVQQGNLHFTVTSMHIYEQHWDRAQKVAAEQVSGSAGEPIRFDPPQRDLQYVDGLFQSWFQIEEMIRKGMDTHAGLVDRFPEPMLQSWLRVLQWWWSGDEDYLTPLAGTRLAASARVGVQPKRVQLNALGAAKESTRGVVCDVVPDHVHPVIGHKEGFVDYVTNLHTEKHAAYGDSWKRRGEMLGIMANVARKIDRLSGGATADETSADTAIDLLVYLAKYRWWMSEELGAPSPGTGSEISIPYPAGGDPGSTNNLIRSLEGVQHSFQPLPVNLGLSLEGAFNNLERAIMDGDPGRFKIVDSMLPYAYALAFLRWSEQR